MKIPITNPVTHAVANVEIQVISVNVRNDTLTLSLSYRWLDAAGEVLKSDSKSYYDSELEAMFQAMGGTFAPFSAFFRSLFPVGKSPGMHMEVSDEGTLTLTTGTGLDCPDGVCRYTETVIPTETLDTRMSDNGLNRAAVTGALAALVQALT